ncbi:MAG: 50S ribosomal protein L25, partial [Hyphomicrobiaceae bacterium]|nr:50S ribosomal protein L25 [Hyphomicrobiaceae bacterium]
WIVRHEIEVTCPYDKIPPHFEVDLTGLEIGRSIHISAVSLPDGMTPTIKDRDFTIATIAGRVKQEEEEVATAAPEEGAAPAAAGEEAGDDAKAAGGDAKPADAKGGDEKKKQ